MTSGRFSIVFDLRDGDNERTGERARALARLIGLGFPVPDGFIVNVDACRTHFWRSGAKNKAAEGLSSLQNAELRRMILREPLAPDVADAVSAAYMGLCPGGEPVAVRPSALLEPATDADPGTVYESVTNVSGVEAVLGAVKKIWSSMWIDEAVEFREKAGIEGEPLAGLVIQRMVSMEAAGAVVTVDRKSGDPQHAIVRAIGKQRPQDVDSYTIELCSHSISERVQGGEAALSDDLVLEAAELALMIDEKLGSRLEIQWSFDGERFWVLDLKQVTRLPGFFPAAWTGKDDDKLKWIRLTDTPVSHFSRNLGIYRRESIPTPFKAARHSLIRRCHNGYVYTSVRWPSSESQRSAVSRLMSRISYSREQRTARKVIKLWEKQVAPFLKRGAFRLVKASHTRVSLPKLAGRLKRAFQLHAIMLDWFDILWYPSLRIPEMLEEAVRDSGGDDYLLARLLSGINGLTSSKLLELLALQGSTEPESAETLQKIELIAYRYGYTYQSPQQMADVASWRSWLEDPTPLQGLAPSLNGAQRKPDAQKAAHEAEAALHEACASLNLKGRRRIRRLVELSRQWLPKLDERETMLAMVETALRQVAIELGHRLVDRGGISEPNDVFMFTDRELLSLPKRLKSSGACELRRLVIQRKHQLWMDGRLDAPESLPLSQDPGRKKAEVPDVPQFTGDACSPGLVVGSARVARTMEEANDLKPGEILVTDRTGLVWTPYLAVATAFVAEDGHKLSREAVVARDLGVPCVLGARGATGIIKTGDLIAVDGDKGVIQRRHLASDTAKRLETSG